MFVHDDGRNVSANNLPNDVQNMLRKRDEDKRKHDDDGTEVVPVLGFMVRILFNDHHDPDHSCLVPHVWHI